MFEFPPSAGHEPERKHDMSLQDHILKRQRLSLGPAKANPASEPQSILQPQPQSQNSTAGNITAEAFLISLRPILLRTGTVAPRVFELIEITGLEHSVLESLLEQNCRNGSLVQVSRNRYYLPETIIGLARYVQDLAAQQADKGFTVIQFRDGSGIGRNLSVEILEFFDRCSFTRREENARFLSGSTESLVTAMRA
jgi:hypothetical protein